MTLLDKETYKRLIRNNIEQAIAMQSGESRTTVTKVLRDKRARKRRERMERLQVDELEEIAEHCASLPVLDNRLAGEILGYGETGLPHFRTGS